MGGRQVPIFYVSPTQINAMVPNEQPVGVSTQVLVHRGNLFGTPVFIDIAATDPGVLQYGQQEAIAVDVNGNLIGPSNPAHAGNVLVMYCLGLGAVTQAVADGAAAPSSPLAIVVNPVTLTVGTQTANVLFAGLTPDLAGLYQVNFVVPQGTAAGEVPVIVSVGGQFSVAVNLAVQ